MTRISMFTASEAMKSPALGFYRYRRRGLPHRENEKAAMAARPGIAGKVHGLRHSEAYGREACFDGIVFHYTKEDIIKFVGHLDLLRAISATYPGG